MKNVIQLNFNDQVIHADKSAWFNATEMAAIYGKEAYEFLRSKEAKSYIAALERKYGKFPYLKTKRGIGGGTWFHQRLAVRFAQWLDDDFAIWCDEQIEQILTSDQDWLTSRQESSLGYQLMSEMVQVTREAEGKRIAPYHYSNEALLCNWALTGHRVAIDRKQLNKAQLKMMTKLETNNAALLAQGMAHDKRKVRLWEMAKDVRESQPSVFVLPARGKQTPAKGGRHD